MLINSTFKTAFLNSIENKHNQGRYAAQVKRAARLGSGAVVITDSIRLSFLTAKKMQAWGQI